MHDGKGSRVAGCEPSNLRIPALRGRGPPVPDSSPCPGYPGRVPHGSCPGGVRRAGSAGSSSKRIRLRGLDLTHSGPGDPELFQESLPARGRSGFRQIDPCRPVRSLPFTDVSGPDPAGVHRRPVDGRRQKLGDEGIFHSYRPPHRACFFPGRALTGLVYLSHGNTGISRRGNFFRFLPGDRQNRHGNLDNRLGGKRCEAVN